MLSLEIANLNEWLIIATPDGTAPVAWKPVGVEIFSKLVLTIKAITQNYSQVVLNDSLYNRYLKYTTDGRIASTSHAVVDYHFLSNPVPTGSNSWTATLLNQTIPDKYFICFRSEKNTLNPKGNPFFFSNPGLVRLSMKIPECSLNRFNQHRKSFWTADTSVIVKSYEEYVALSINKQKLADFANQDLILNQNLLIAGDNVAALQRETYICNLKSIYRGHCVYTFSCSIQTQTNSTLKEATRKGNIEFLFDFAKPTTKKYYITIFGVHNGSFYR